MNINETSTENYMETYKEVIKMFKENKINNIYYQYKSFGYTGKISFCIIDKYVSQLIVEKEKKENLLLFNESLLKDDYHFSEYVPLKLNNIFNEKVSTIVKNYYRETISKSLFELGDHQSNRYKGGN